MDQTENSTPRQAPLQGNAADDEIDLLALLGAFIDNRWTIIASTFVAAVMAVAVAVLSTPIYQAGAMLQVEEKAASLNSGDCFVLLTPGTMFVWRGEGANDTESNTAELVAMTLQSHRVYTINGSQIYLKSKQA